MKTDTDNLDGKKAIPAPDGIDLHAMARESPDLLVERLLAEDMDWWNAVKRQVLDPFFRGNAAYRRRMEDRDIELDDIFDYLVDRMARQKKLLALRNRHYVCSFLRDYAKHHVLSFFERKPRGKDGKDGVKRKPRAKMVPLDAGLSEEDTAACAVPPAIPESLGHPDLTDERLGTFQAMERDFLALWEKNPRRATVLLLRYVKGLQSKDVQRFLALASDNYVNQVVNLAKGDIRASRMPLADALPGETERKGG